MEPITLDASESQPVILKTKARDGTISEHHFEMLIFNQPRLVQYQVLVKKAHSLEQKDTLTPKEQLEMASATAAALDLRVQSTNGPVTITSLWDDGIIGLEHLQRLGKLLGEVDNPPA